MIGAPVDDDLTFVDEFCGAGGGTQGLSEAGFVPILAVNHWDVAISTHAANFPDVDHWCEDTSKIDMRRLPHARVLWASPICTEMSPAGGRKRRRKQTVGQLELEELGHIPKAGYVRTRTTFYDVLRAVEVRRFDAVLIENVVDVAADWELFDHWIKGMELLGYNVQFVSVSSAHVGDERNPRAPQWRDRLYLVFTRIGISLPDVEPRPLAWCSVCVADTYALQSWKKPGRHIGKYGSQYTYVCERSTCRHARVEPYVVPAAAAIDWSNLGTRIGDRKPRKDGLPLAANTLRRIEAGLWMFGQPITVEKSGNTYERDGSGYVRAWPALNAPMGIAGPPVMLSTNHDDGPRAYPPDAAPLPTRTVKIGDGMAIAPFTVPSGGTWRERPAGLLDEPMGARTTSETDGMVCPPFVAELRGGSSTARPVDNPLATVTAGGNHHGLTIPPDALVMRNYTPRGNWAQMTKRAADSPLGAVTAKDHHSLVIPFRRGGRPHPAGAAPISTLTTREGHGLLLAELGIELYDCLFRMLQPREHLTAQRFPADYIVHGGAGEQTMQAGNAVSCNVPHFLGRAVAIALGASS